MYILSDFERVVMSSDGPVDLFSLIKVAMVNNYLYNYLKPEDYFYVIQDEEKKFFKATLGQAKRIMLTTDATIHVAPREIVEREGIPDYPTEEEKKEDRGLDLLRALW